MSSEAPLEGIEAAKEEARSQLLKGLTPEEIAATSPLSVAQCRGIKGAMVKAGLIEGKKTRPSKHPDEGLEDPLPTERDRLESTLLRAGVQKKKVPSILEFAESYGLDVEGVYQSMGDANLTRSLKKTALKLWANVQDEEIPDFILDQLQTARYPSRDRDGRDKRMTEAEWKKENEISELSAQVKEIKNLIQGGGGLDGFNTRAQGVKYREIRTPIDRNGVPCDPNNAHSIRYERVPISAGGDVQLLRQEISDLKEKLFSDQIQGLANQIEDLKERGSSDVGAIVSGVKDVLTSWSESEGGPLARAASPLVDAFGRKVLENYNAFSPMPPEMVSPEEGTPQVLVDRMREHGLVSTFRSVKVKLDAR